MIFFFFFLQLYRFIEISFMKNSGCFSPGKASCDRQESHYPTSGASWVFGVSMIHQTLTWTTESLMRTQM